jgi:hypothetical protein
MGDRIELGRLIYNVFEAHWVTHLGEQPSTRVPNNRFLLLRVSVVNSGGSALSVPPLQLVDDAGQTYAELSDGAQAPNWIGILREVKPAESLQGNVLFDVNPAHYKLRVTDETEERAGLVNIPLQFQPETPEVPTPVLQDAPNLPLRSPQDAR